MLVLFRTLFLCCNNRIQQQIDKVDLANKVYIRDNEPIPILVAYITIQAPRKKVPPKICTQVPGQPRGEGWSWEAPFFNQFVNIQCLLYTSMINYFASYDVHIGLFYFLTSLCWNRHSEDSKKVRHLKIGPLVQKLQIFK